MREDNSIVRDAYFISWLMWVSGRTLKDRIAPSSLAEPLLKARDGKNQKDPREQRREDEEYLKKRFEKYLT